MGTDLSFNVIALDNASKTFIRLSEQVERFADRLDKLDRKDVTVKVDVKTDKAFGNLDLLETRFQKIAAGIIATSGFAGAAILGGVGAGFIGIAGLAQKSNQDVQESYKGLWRNVAATTKNATDQLVPQIVGAGNAMSAEVVKLGPQIDRAFSFAGPSIVALTDGLTSMADNAMPGVTDAMENSLPVMVGFSSLMGQLGTTVGGTLSELSQHSDEFGLSVHSLGGVVSAAGGTATSVIVDLNHVWAQNAGGIVSATEGIGETISGVATGAVPVLSAGLGALTGVVSGITDVLGPVAPILGTIGTVALATWAAMKLAGLATVGVKLLATGVLNLGANMEVGAAKTAGFIAAQRGVAVSASATATAVTAAGAATARASIGFAAAASSLAGPIGLAIAGGTILFGLLSDSQDHAAESSLSLAASTDQLASAFTASHGAANQSTQDALVNSDTFKKAADAAATFGISQADLMKAIVQGGPALDDLRNRLTAIALASKAAIDGGNTSQEAIDHLIQAGLALQGLDNATKAYTGGQQRAREFNAAQVEVGTNLLRTSEYQQGAAGTAQALGLGLGEVAGGFRIVIATGTGASNSVQDVAAAFITSRLAIANAETALKDHFVNADKAIVSAQSSLNDANHSAAASTRSVMEAQHSLGAATRSVTEAQHSAAAATRSVADAQHSLVGAQRAVQDAYAGVGTAQQAYTRAQEQARDAELDLSDARQQSIQDLKDLHAQLEDQTLNEAQAKVRLFEALQEGGKLGVSEGNAKSLATQSISTSNADQVRAALGILSAQSALNHALRSGEELRKDVAEADRLGVEGSDRVVSAQESLAGAHDQVASAADGLARAHQAVEDAAYGLQRAHQAVQDAEYSLARAHQAVQDAAYGLQRAHQAVQDAEYSRGRSADRVTAAQQALKDAQDAASRSLDINTKAGQDNLRQIMSLWGAIQANIPIGDRSNELIRQTAAAFGISTDAAQGYLTKLGLIPADFKYSVTAVAGADLSAITEQTINGVRIFTSRLGAGGIASAGRLAAGGPIVGAGGPTDDQVPIMASHGEWMQPADAVNYYGTGVMEAMRQKRLRIVGSDGAALPGFAKGGLIDAFATYANLSTSYLANVNALQVMGLPHPPQLPRYVPPVVASGGPVGQVNFVARAGVAQWTPQILQALGLLGQPASWLATVQRRMNQESGGNPTVVNLWDSNAKRGTPSVGLMQVIKPTFEHNAGQFVGTGPFSYGVSVDPLANIFAGLNYAIHRYGSLSALNRPGGYDSGGWLMPGGTNQTGKPEAVLDPAESAAFVQMAKAGAGGNHYHLNVYAPIGSQRELENWFVKMQDKAKGKGRAR